MFFVLAWMSESDHCKKTLSSFLHLDPLLIDGDDIIGNIARAFSHLLQHIELIVRHVVGIAEVAAIDDLRVSDLRILCDGRTGRGACSIIEFLQRFLSALERILAQGLRGIDSDAGNACQMPLWIERQLKGVSFGSSCCRLMRICQRLAFGVCAVSETSMYASSGSTSGYSFRNCSVLAMTSAWLSPLRS